MEIYCVEVFACAGLHINQHYKNINYSLERKNNEVEKVVYEITLFKTDFMKLTGL